jgi:porin
MRSNKLVGMIGVIPAFVAYPSIANAQSDLPLPPGVTVALRETVDAYAVPAGTAPGTALLNKLQLSATLRGERVGLPGWQFHAQIIRLAGQSLSSRMGDVQTADNIEAPHALRLFEAYFAKTIGTNNRQIALRLGLMDLNSQFDSIDPAAVMINSSHGIGPDLSHSGLNGPSIFPVSAIGASGTWVKSKQLTFRLGLFDGVAGSPSRPGAFFAERLKPSDGLLVIGQMDWLPNKDSRVETGLWSYTAAQLGPDDRRARARGAYVSYEGPVKFIPDTQFWVRFGLANPRAQDVAAYFGGGVVRRGLIRGRKDDRLGIAVAHAMLGSEAVRALGVYRGETSIEATYQAKLSSRFLMQPDVEFIHHPAGVARAPDSVGIGLRLVFASAAPKQMQATDPGDPTVPPDGAPTIAGN